MKLKLNKTNIELLELSKKRYRVHDTELAGLIIAVSATKKTWYIYKWMDDKPHEWKLGDYPNMQPDAARKMALEYLALIERGIDPVKRDPAKRTVMQIYEDYIASRSLRAATLKGYGRMMKEDQSLGRWRDTPLNNITRKMVAEHYDWRAAESPSRAAHAMRLLRSLWNFAQANYRDKHGNTYYGENPVQVLSDTKRWTKLKRRQTVVQPYELKVWWDTCSEIAQYRGHHGKIATYFQLLLLTGMRGSALLNLCTARRSDENGEPYPYYNPKIGGIEFLNKNNQTTFIPLSAVANDIIKDLLNFSASPFVFPRYPNDVVSPPISESLTRKTRKMVKDMCEVEFTRHDLRRTFASIAAALQLNKYTIKELMGHTTDSTDVTDGYIIALGGSLKEATEQVSAQICELVGYQQPQAESEGQSDLWSKTLAPRNARRQTFSK